MSESVSTMHVPSLIDDVVPSAGATPAPTDTVDMRVPSVASTIPTSSADVKTAVGVGSEMSKPASTVHVLPLVNCDDPSAGATPAPTDTVDMRVPSVASTISTSRVGADSSVGVYPAPTTTVAGFHVVAMNSCSAVKSSPNDTVGPPVSTINIYNGGVASRR